MSPAAGARCPRRRRGSPDRSRTPCRAGRRRRSGRPSRGRCAARSARAPTRARPRVPRPRRRPRARRPRARRSARCSLGRQLLAFALLRRLDARERTELAVREPSRERGERLAFTPAVEPALDKARNGGVELLREDPAEQRPPDRGIATETATDEDVVGLPAAAVLVARRRPLEAEVGDPVLRTRVRAAVEVETEIGDLRSEALLQRLDQAAEPRLRLSHREVAVRLAGAGDPGRPDVIHVEWEADRGELGARGLDVGVGHVRDDEVLLARDTDVAAEALGEVGDRDHLVAGDKAEVHGHADVAEPGLLLLVDADVIARRDRSGGEREVLERAAEPRLDALPHALRAGVVDNELEPRLHPRDAVAEVLAPDTRDAGEHLDRLFFRDENAEVPREARHRRESAADPDGEALPALVEDADERDAVDLGGVAAIGAGGDRVLVLARQIDEIGVAVEDARRLLDHVRAVEELVSVEPLHRAAGDVPDGVSTASRGRQSRGIETPEHLWKSRELEPVQLDVLTR